MPPEYPQWRIDIILNDYGDGPMGQGDAVEIAYGSTEYIRDVGDGTAENPQISPQPVGFTHPNLHRRIAKDQLSVYQTDGEDGRAVEAIARTYTLGIHGTNSYRTTTVTYRDEEDRDALYEIP